MACEGLDLSKINRDEFVADNETIWIKAEVLEKTYKLGEDAYTVIEFSDGCFNVVCEDQNVINHALLFWTDTIIKAEQGLIVNPPSGTKRGENGAICGIPDLPKFEEAIKAVDSNAINQFGFQPAAMMPNACCIPMRSNIKIYGPYVSANFGQCGGTNSESDPDLCPWAFGSAALMNAAGNAKANSYPQNFTPEVETGSITVPELPNINLGSAPAGGGPNLTGVNISFGSSGITTNYTFQTYTPKAGGFTRLFIDRLKNVAKYRQEQIKFLRNNRLDINKINRRLRVINNINRGGNNPRDNARADQNTAQRVLVGEIYDFHPDVSGQRTVVAMTTLPKAIQEMRYDFDKKAYMSLDGLLGPVSTNGGGGLPAYASYSGLSNDPPCHRASPISPHPPFATGDITSIEQIDSLDQYNLHIERKNINPFSNPDSNEYRGDSDVNSGHVIDIVGRPSGTLEDGVITNFYLGNKNGEQYAEDYRFLGLRGPLVLHSWGFDTNGKPIPNRRDDLEQIKLGIFRSEELQDEFLSDWLKKPMSWPVAPVDLRFDRDRGVWVSPPSYKIVVAKLEEDLDPYGKALASIVTKNTTTNQEYSRPLFDKDGNKVKAEDEESDAKIIIIDRIGESFKKDSLVYTYYDTHKCEYIILSGGQPKSPIVRFKLIDICPSLTAPPIDETWGDNWTEYAGYGDKFFDNISITDSYALRLNCNGEPIDKSGNILESINLETIKEHLIIVRDVAGKWGPAFSRYTDFETWKKRAAEGYAAKIINPSPSGSGSSSSEECDLRTPCLITYLDEDGNTQTIDENYDIIYLESYARFIHGCLKQDLYTKTEDTTYASDYWKNLYPSGNALIEVDKFYGYSDNGKEPYFLDANGEEVDIRVFDPWVSSSGVPIGCYKPEEFHLYSAKSGTPVVAVFNETLKRYDIIEIAQKPLKTVRFRLYNCRPSEASSPNWENEDIWSTYAGFFDKTPNNHVLGVRIDCDGNPVDKNGKILTDADISLENENKKDIFINLLDTAGKFGPSFAGYKDFNHWKTNASTGFGTLCEIMPSGNCVLGNNDGLCSELDSSFDTYEIIFLESYARYIHGCLKQDLYISSEKAAIKYAGDIWKTTYPSGNASVDIIKYYGGVDNNQEPKFYNADLEEISVRVFDPWVNSDGSPITCYSPKDSQFYSAKSGTPFIAVLNEKNKRYELIQIGIKEETNVRFKLFKKCSSSQEAPNYGDSWTTFAGYRDKFPNQHILGIRIDCDGNPIDINNNLINDADINNPNKASDIFINLFDTAGKFGPSYAEYTNFNEWKNKAANGFAAKINKTEFDCSGLGVVSACAEFSEDYPSFNILFLESYARFLHGCLTQDLYPSNTEEYSEDTYKTSYPSGNAAIASGYICYGDAPNGNNPIYIDTNGNNVGIRVFDPWFEEVSCYDPKKSQFYNATSGTAFTAIFNEDKKKYYLWNIDTKPKAQAIRFRLIDCGSGIYVNNNNIEALNDNWSQYASYGDKFLNNHILGIRINCDGDPIDKNNNIINDNDITEAIADVNGNKAKNILVNLFDTCGSHGPAYAAYKNYGDWILNGATGFAIACEPAPSGCVLGVNGEQCLNINDNLDSYDIFFLESYARFVECTLQQDLYPTPIKLVNYANDPYKVANPYGNGSAVIYNTQDFYGNSPNGNTPKFYNSDGIEIPFRVFDPYLNESADRNPFRGLKEGDRVLCIFNEKLKKYIIYSSIEANKNEVIKFALVSDKNPGGFSNIKAVRINNDRKPITLDASSIIADQQTFENNWFLMSDPFFGPAANLRSTLGPALGSPWLIEHLEGISLPRGYAYPFIGYALKHYMPTDVYGSSSLKYEIINLEHYAQYISGKVASTKATPYYQGVTTYSTNGVSPLTRELVGENADVLLSHGLDVQKHPIVGAEVDEDEKVSGFSASNIDGCLFEAILDGPASTTTKLVYNIVHAETVAMKGTTKLILPNNDNNIGFESINIVGFSMESADNTLMQSVYRQGFMWDKIKSKTTYELTKLVHPFSEFPHLTQNSIIHTQFDSIDVNTGQLVYEIISEYPIAEHGIRFLNNINNPGLFGSSHLAEADPRRKINQDGEGFFQGISPADIADANSVPTWQISPTPDVPGIDKQEWMTFKDSRIVGAWIDRPVINGGIGAINNGYYLILHAQEAPVIITGKAQQEFTPEIANNISIDISEAIYGSSQGYNQEPISDTLLVNVENPMGYGAKAGDFVTIQRVWTPTAFQNVSNYKYIVIGTSHPPGPLK